MVWTGGGRNNQGPVFRDSAAWSFSRSPGLLLLLLAGNAERWKDAKSSASSAHTISVSPLKYETDTAPDWNPEFANGRAPQEAYFLLIPICLQPSTPSGCSLCQSVFVYIFGIDQCLSQGNHQLHKESHGGDSSLHVGLVQHLKPYG